ncbi:hypothetical protein BC831DRAFT_449436 [Entophlyctis helioformis]|nr:hypothetical protein BC831DRAFT_449436 [Entophlyctis helioformis]
MKQTTLRFHRSNSMAALGSSARPYLATAQLVQLATLSLLSIGCSPVVQAQQVIVPPGAMLPTNLPSPAPTANPFRPNRTSLFPPAAGDPSMATDRATAFDTYHFVVKDFIIVLGAVFAGIGLIIGLLVLFRWFRSGGQASMADEQRFEQEQRGLAERTAGTLERNRSERREKRRSARASMAASLAAAASGDDQLMGPPHVVQVNTPLLHDRYTVVSPAVSSGLR